MTRTVETRIDPVTKWVRSLPGRYYRLVEAAEQLGVSHMTLRRLLHSKPQYGPSKIGKIGEVEVYLYTRADIERIRAYYGDSTAVTDFVPSDKPRTVGRPAKWTPVQKKERQRLYSKRDWWTKKVQKLQADPAAFGQLAAAQEVLSEVQKTLDAMTPGAPR